MKPLAFLSGGSGYLGSNLVRRLVREGWRVGVLFRGKPNWETFHDVGGDVLPVETDGGYKDLDSWFERHKPEAVFHLASLFLTSHSSDKIEALISSNLLLGTHLAEVCMQHGCHVFINTGTSWQTNTERGRMPVNLYAATKSAFEEILNYYSDATGLRVLTLRLFDTYGPGDARRKLIPMLIDSFNLVEPLKLSPGEQLLDLVYIDDVVEAFWMALKIARRQDYTNNSVFGVRSGQMVSIKELVRQVQLVYGRPPNVVLGAIGYRAREVMTPPASLSTLPGWTPKIDLLSGLCRIREYEMSRGKQP